ncbi:Hpt domain-containing protein [Pelagicoccus mobilis]|uniref:Hpt domain-containing protein n=1 Tax=Pelagicoccus mobilis TaxID=415221 RepID=A0A934RYU8_9BACT|nr:Hpt domain-containing protein [Pelagicoccus mobilis]MBK1878025.1 Hpt domain-containing protein [Pelagicoccus mobilis]
MSEPAYKSQELFVPELLLSRLMEDRDLMREVLDACLPDLRTNHRLFSSQLESGDLREALRTIHTIKGSAQNADLKSLAFLARDIEEHLKNGQAVEALALLGELSRVVGASVQAVEGYFLAEK